MKTRNLGPQRRLQPYRPKYTHKAIPYLVEQIRLNGKYIESLEERIEQYQNYIAQQKGRIDQLFAEKTAIMHQMPVMLPKSAIDRMLKPYSTFWEQK